MSQYFKGDDTEKKFFESVKGSLDTIDFQKDEFFTDCYESQPFGDLIFDLGISPLSNAIAKDIFRQTFNEVFQNFVTAGSFESYIAVFQKIFGAGADIQFTVPAAGKLQIDILADGIELENFVARTIVMNQYVYEEVLTQADENILFQTIKGFQSQYELEQMLFEMVPDGIYTEISLTLG